MRIIASAAALAAAGCGLATTYQTADVLPPGRWRAQAALTSGAYIDRPQELRTPAAIGELSVRRGVGHRLEVGGTIYTTGIEVAVQRQLTGEAACPRRWCWAVGLAVGGTRMPDSALAAPGVEVHGRATALATRRLSARWAITTGPVLTASEIWFAGGGSADGVLLGGFGNAAWRFGQDGRWRLVPELSLHLTAIGDVPVRGAVLHLGAAIAREL